MAWTALGLDENTGQVRWVNNGQEQFLPQGQDPNGSPNLYGWNPNMAVPEGGFTVGQLLAPNYLSQGSDISDPAKLAAAVRDVAPYYNGPLDMNAQVPISQMRPESAGEFPAFLAMLAPPIMGMAGLAAGAAGGAGAGSSGGGMWDWLGNLFGGDVSPVSGWENSWGDIGGLPGASSGGPLMPPAVPETAQQLTEWGPTDWLKYGSQLLGNSGSMFGQGGLFGGLAGAGIGALLGGLGESKQIGTATNTTTSGVNSTLTGPSVNQLLSTIRGDYLNPASNPYLQDTYNMGAKSLTDNYNLTTRPQTDQMFGAGGQAFGGNSGYQEMVARNQWGLGNQLNNLATNIYGQNYQTERGRQLAAATPFSGTSQVQTTPIYANKLGGMLSGAMGGGILGSKLFG